MSKEKIAITLDGRYIGELDRLVDKNVFKSRSQAIQVAVSEKLLRMKRTRLAEESAKLEPAFERTISDEGFTEDMNNGPNIKRRDSMGRFNPTRGHEQTGLRPVLILSHDIFNERSGTVIVTAITSQPQQAGFPLTLALKTGDLPKLSWVKISQIRTLSTERLGKLIGRLSEEELAQVIEGLNEIIA